MSTEIDIIERTLDAMQDNIDRLQNGGINCVAYPYERSRSQFPGMLRRWYLGIMAGTKVGKSQFTYNTFVFEPLMRLYYGNENFELNYIIFALEETYDRVIQRFMSWLLYRESRGKINVSPTELRSTLKPCPKEAMDMIKDDHIQDILAFFRKHVTFPDESPNPTGIYNYCKSWAEERGTVHNTKYESTDEFGEKILKEQFSHYTPNDPDAFNVVIIDPVNRLDRERGMDERETMKKLSEYCTKYLRNRYGFTCIIVQQQSFSAFSTDAAKIRKFEPTVGDGGGSKEISQDLDAQLALYCPDNFDVDNYSGYDIKKLRKRALFVRCTINRDGEGGGITPLFFDGRTSQFWELPRPTESGKMLSVYNYAEQLRLPHTMEELAALNPFLKKEQPKPKNDKVSLFNLLFHPK